MMQTRYSRLPRLHSREVSLLRRSRAVTQTVHAAAAVAERPIKEAASTSGTGVENVVIIGSGPAGYTAAIYCARANLKPVVFEGSGRGGQLMTTSEVENFPGFPEGITGPDLMDRMRKQSERWGAELVTDDVESIDLSRRPFTVRTAEVEVKTNSIIIATGATAKRLSLPSEEQFWSKGISACAICDGASPLFKKRPVAVVGGGDSAAEEAVYLTKYASHVHLLVRGERMRASKAMADRAMDNKNVTVHFNTGIKDVYGDDVVRGLKLFNTKSGEEFDLEAAGLFYGIGHSPNSKLLEGQIELRDNGYVQVEHGAATSVEGVFAAGDLHDAEWRQAITAAGSGCMAALSAERYLTANNLLQEYHQQPASQTESQPEATTSTDEEAVNDMENFDMDAEKHCGQYALRKLYHESKRLIAVVYTSPTCGPCRTLKPILQKLFKDYVGKIHYVEIDIEKDGEVAEAAGVNGTPTVQFFKNKSRLYNLPGVKMKKEYRELIEANL